MNLATRTVRPKTNRKKFVFVLMPFGQEFNDIYKRGIKEACKAAGAYCQRVDEQFFQGTILERVYDQITKADLIISDMTGRNANVFYETGFAHARGKKVILLAQSVEDIPFDTKHYPHIIYEGDVEKLKKELRRPVRVYLEESDSEVSHTEASAKDVFNTHTCRRDLINVFKDRVSDKRINSIYICGISLRDFLTEQGIMREVWKKIKERLKEEKDDSEMPNKQRLRVRLLLLDPQSSAGFFRFKVEKPRAIGEEGDVKAGDIQSAVNEIEDAIGEIYGSQSQNFLEARLYEHSPFSFMFLTDTSVFVEQYYYKKWEGGADLPTIEYGAKSEQYKQLRASVDIIWEHAHNKRITVGTFTPIKVANIRNIYRVNKREELARRQVESIRNANDGTLDILSITGRYFLDPDHAALKPLKFITSPKHQHPVKLRFALLNPVCQQAIFRAVADGRLFNEIPAVLKRLNWKSHKTSNLYDGVTKTAARISDLIDQGHSIELRLYSCSTTNSLLITPDATFAGTYIYGRSQEGTNLKSEYPVIEYANEANEFTSVEAKILKCTFDIIWSYYSISYQEYEARIYPNEEEEFNKNLTRIREELGISST